MLGHQACIRLEVQGGAIQGTAVALNDAQYQTCPRARRKPGQRLGFTAWHVDSVGKIAGKGLAPLGQPRSEEHTSELQSLMRISYAVFCLKTKTTNSRQHKIHD